MKYRVISRDVLLKGSQIPLLIFLVIFLGYGTIGVALSNLISYLIGFLAILYLLSKNILPKFRKVTPRPNYKELLDYSWPLLFVSVMGTILSKTDQVMLGYFLDSSQVGIYRSAILLAAVLTVVLTSLRKIILPVLSDLLGKEKEEEFERTFKTSIKWVFTVSLPLFVIMVLFPSNILRFVFGKEYMLGATSLSILAITYFIKACFGLSSSLLKSLEKTKLILLATMASGLLNVLFNFLLIPKFGMEGAAIAYLISITVLYSLYMILGRKCLKTQPFKFSVVKSILATGGAAIPTYLLFKYVVSPVQAWMLPIAFLAFILLYSIGFLVLGGIDEEDIVVLKAVENKTGLKSQKIRGIIKRFI